MATTNNPYTISRCRDCDIASKLASGIFDSDLCQACQLVRECYRHRSKSEKETFTQCNTSKGKLQVSSKHGKNEKRENVRIGTYLAEKHDYDITLLANLNGTTSPDSYNSTLHIYQEYKVSSTSTKSSIDNLLRNGARQADNIVLSVKSDISLHDLSDAISDRVRRTRLESVTVIIAGKDKTYTRAEIIRQGFKIQQADLK